MEVLDCKACDEKKSMDLIGKTYSDVFESCDYKVTFKFFQCSKCKVIVIIESRKRSPEAPITDVFEL